MTRVCSILVTAVLLAAPARTPVETPRLQPAVPATALSPHAQESVRIEYIAHASFVIESPGGIRVAIDPFNSNIWLGYSFPRGIEADGVVVTHPHYDHDATYYFSDFTAVLRRPGSYTIGDVTILGVESEHAGRARFLDRGQTPFNTVWVVEVGGLRIAHLGDNRLLNEVDLDAIGRVDVVLLGASYFDAANDEMLALLLAEAAPRVLIPMHYRHHEISELPRGMRPVGEYLQAHEAEFFESNIIELAEGSLPPDPQIVVLKPSPDIVAWPESLHDAWVEANEGAGMLSDSEQEDDAARAEEALWEGLFHYEAAMDLAPDVLKFGYGAGRALAMLDQVSDAIETLDHALARAPQADWTDRLRVHVLLGELYEQAERPDVAIVHYEYVAAHGHTHETTLRDRAIERLDALRTAR